MNETKGEGIYYPYLRGKQFELILLREQQKLLARNSFMPIVEPVNGSLNALEKTLEVLMKNQTGVGLILNPQNGDLKDGQKNIEAIVDEKKYAESDYFSVCYIIDSATSLDQIRSILFKYPKAILIHDGFSRGQELSRIIDQSECRITNLFIDGQSPKLYRRHFHARRVLNHDGFNRCGKNKDYPDVETFSDLHCTYQDENMDGFSDFLINGNEYMEVGGPAYTIAIHLTFIDADLDNQMFIYHFKSDRTEGSADPGGKFMEALAKLVKETNRDNSKILRTGAVEEYIHLFEEGHFPGLGYIKKLSMQHHLEILADFLSKQA